MSDFQTLDIVDGRVPRTAIPSQLSSNEAPYLSSRSRREDPKSMTFLPPYSRNASPRTEAGKHRANEAAEERNRPAQWWWIWGYNPEKDQLDPELLSVIANTRVDHNILSSSVVESQKLNPTPITSPITLEDGAGNKVELAQSVELGWVGKYNKGGIIQCLVMSDGRAPRETVMIGRQFLLDYRSVLFEVMPVTPPKSIERILSSTIRTVDPGSRRTFFRRGGIIRAFWPQPQPYPDTDPDGTFRLAGWTEKVHAKLTWFTIVQTFKTHCVAVPIHTYNGKATTKPGINADDHAALVLKGQNQILVEGEKNLSREPFHMLLETTSVELEAASRINFAKPYTIEYNIKVMKVGRIVTEDITRLLQYFLISFLKIKPSTSPKQLDDMLLAKGVEIEKQVEAFDPRMIYSEATYNRVVDDGFLLLGETKAEFENLKVENHFDKIDNWLRPPDASVNFNRALEQRHKDSGQWLLQTQEFKAWKRERGSFLWLSGIPGSGKTILSSIIIEDLVASSPSLLYFYFDVLDLQKQSVENAVRSLMCQLYHKSEGAGARLDSLFMSCQNGRQQPDIKSLCATFEVMLQQADEVWIVLDGLDECNSRFEYGNGGLFPWIQQLRSSLTDLHLFVTSCQGQDITQSFLMYSHHEYIIRLENDLIKDDICRYVQARIRESKELSRWHSRSDMQNNIEADLTMKANGMFRWVACQLDVLEKCLDVREVRIALANLPKTLAETYDRIFRSIRYEHLSHAKRILQFLCFSEQPLRIDEVVDAVAIDMANVPRFEIRNRMPIPEEISRYCSSLVVVTAKDNSEKRDTFIQLVHFSVKEYLKSTQVEREITKDFEETTARAAIAEACLAYLLDLNPASTLNETKRLYPLAQYCAQYWTDHARIAESYSESLRMIIVDFFSCKKSFQICWELWSFGEEGKTPPVLYYASRVGLAYCVKSLIDKGEDVNAQGGYFSNALQAASYCGYDQIVQTLVNNGADINAKGGEYGSALQAASYCGYDQIVQTLIKNGADVNAQGGRYGNALQAATNGGHNRTVQTLLNLGAGLNAQGGEHVNAVHVASIRGRDQIGQTLLSNSANLNLKGVEYGNSFVRNGANLDMGVAEIGQMPILHVAKNGHQSVVYLLLANSADIEAKDKHGRTILSYAAENGHETVIQLLLEKGADIEVRNKDGRTALFYAAENGHEAVVRLLLQKGGDIETKDKDGRTIMSYAAGNGHAVVVRLLLEYGAETRARSKDGWTALFYAAENGHEAVVKLLLEKSDNIEAKDKDERTILSFAAGNGHAAVVQLLLEYGADIEARNQDRRTALFYAAENGHEAVVKLLLAKGGNVEAKDKDERTILSFAAGNGHAAVVQLLLENGADIEARNKDGWTALFYAAEGGHATVVRLLVDKGDNVEAKDKDGRTLLSHAAEGGHQAMIQLLLKRGADIDTKNDEYWTPLFYAARGGHGAIVQLLLEKGADIEAKDGDGGTPLLYAAEEGQETVVKQLLEKGANIEAKDDYGGTPLFYAAQSGYETVVRLLLDRGADIGARDDKDWTPLMYAGRGERVAVVQLLIDRGADIEAKDRDGQTLLLFTAKNGYEILIQLLLDKGANIEATDDCNGTPLSLAAEGGHKSSVQLLLDHGAEINAKDDYGGTPLLRATYNQHGAIVQLLLDNGADINAQDRFGRSPLLDAVESRDKAILRLLLDKGADIETKNNDGWTPLLYAAKDGHEPAVHLLIDKGADIEAKDKNARTPVSHAVEKGHKAVVQLLLDKSAIVETQDKHGRTPLSYAAEKGRETIIQLLLDKGVDIEARDQNNRTPLSLASQNGHKAVVQILLGKRQDQDIDRERHFHRGSRKAIRHSQVPTYEIPEY